MALIKCPECKRKISNMAVSCPHCGFVLEGKYDLEKPNDITDRSKNGKKAVDVLVSIIRLEWAETINDYLSDIPLIGCLLSGIFMLLCLAGTVTVVGTIVIGFFWGLSLIHPMLAVVAGAAGFNILAYCVSYVWGARKPWFFWACLSMTVFAFLLVLQ